MSCQFSFLFTVGTNFCSKRVVIIVGFLILVLEGTPKCDDDEEANVKDSVVLKEEAISTVVSGMCVFVHSWLLQYGATMLLLWLSAMVCHIEMARATSLWFMLRFTYSIERVF